MDKKEQNSTRVKRVLISGGTGMVGSILTDMLVEDGREVHHLSRNPGRGDHPDAKTYGWDIKRGEIDDAAFDGVDAIVHLAGAGIADERWTEKRRRILTDSRVQSANLLHQAVVKMDRPPACFVSANGINYYGAKTTEHIFVESDPPSEDFIGQLCRSWEVAALQFEPICRVVTLRTSVVLAAEGGALPRIAKPVKWGFGAALGAGRQYMPYIHIDDLCRMYVHAIDHGDMKGAYNATNGEYITNREMTRAIARVWNRPLWLPAVPAFALKAVLGDMAQIVLEGSRATADKIRKTGFEFEYDDIISALEAERLKEKRAGD